MDILGLLYSFARRVCRAGILLPLVQTKTGPARAHKCAALGSTSASVQEVCCRLFKKIPDRRSVVGGAQGRLEAVNTAFVTLLALLQCCIGNLNRTFNVIL